MTHLVNVYVNQSMPAVQAVNWQLGFCDFVIF